MLLLLIKEMTMKTMMTMATAMLLDDNTNDGRGEEEVHGGGYNDVNDDDAGDDYTHDGDNDDPTPPSTNSIPVTQQQQVPYFTRDTSCYSRHWP